MWFSTGVGIPLLEKHRKRSKYMAEHAKVLRANGIIPSLQIQATLGHGDDITAAAGAEGKMWGSYVGVNGRTSANISTVPVRRTFLIISGSFHIFMPSGIRDRCGSTMICGSTIMLPPWRLAAAAAKNVLNFSGRKRDAPLPVKNLLPLTKRTLNFSAGDLSAGS